MTTLIAAEPQLYVPDIVALSEFYSRMLGFSVAFIHGLLAASITQEDAQPLFVEYQRAGVEFVQTLMAEPWGARTFIVRDPDRNLLLFAGRGK